MIDLEKQIGYWLDSANDDLQTAELLIRENRVLHGLFFCHLVMEKVLKAHVVKHTQNVAPRSHNLIFLSEKANIEFDNESEIFLGILMKYQLEGRYPDYNPVIPNTMITDNYFIKTKNLFEWLTSKL